MPKSKSKSKSKSKKTKGDKSEGKDQSPAIPCLTGICNPHTTHNIVAPASKGEYLAVHLKGPGLFLAARITKGGGATNLTFVDLEIDGASIFNCSFAAARNWGLTAQNPFGLVLLENRSKTMALGFPYPLAYRSELKLTLVVDEPNVKQIITEVITGSGA